MQLTPDERKGAAELRRALNHTIAGDVGRGDEADEPRCRHTGPTRNGLDGFVAHLHTQDPSGFEFHGFQARPGSWGSVTTASGSRAKLSRADPAQRRSSFVGAMSGCSCRSARKSVVASSQS